MTIAFDHQVGTRKAMYIFGILPRSRLARAVQRIGRAITCFEGDHVMKTYDLVIIGSGTGAQAASSRMRAVGWSVALIDHRPFGGTCALRGCDPKRVLMSGGEAIDAKTRMRGHGVTGEARIDW